MSYKFQSKEFEGPLELLLSLTQEKKLSINQISLAQITEGYFAYLTHLEEEEKATHEEIAEFLVIASTLILIKSKSLLPGFHLTEEEEEDIGDLEARLKEYKRFKELAEIISGRLTGTQAIFMRPALVGIQAEFLPPRSLELEDLPSVMRRLLEVIVQKPELAEKKIREVISIEDKIQQIEQRITKGIRSFKKFVDKCEDTTEVIVSFLALLELVRHRSLDVSQQEQFGDILVDTIS